MAEPGRWPAEKQWEGELERLLVALATGGRDHETIRKLDRQIRADYAGRFLVELLQNASDQATAAHLTGSTITIVRTKDLVAMTNEGAHFSDKGIESVTSLALSPKDPEESIGNKGIGFKSVFEVTAAPEIFSASTSSRSFVEPGGVRLRLAEHPFDDPAVESAVRDLAPGIVARRPEDAKKAAGRFRADVADVLVSAACQSAGFRYPIGLDQENLAARLEQLELPEFALRAQTLVVLPLLEGAAITVDAAFDEVLENDGLSPVGAFCLFLPSVTRLAIEDRVRGKSFALTREDLGNERTRASSRGTQVFKRRTRLSTSGSGGAREQTQDWWLASRVFGGDGPLASAEVAALTKAATSLPEGWERVRRVTVTVALPDASDSSEAAPLPPTGRFCIGLPTLQPTGSPFWADAHFHGSMDRKRIDFEKVDFNGILLGETEALVGDLFDVLKAAKGRGTRRLTTLSLSREDGPLARRLFRDGGLASGPVVLDIAGRRWLRPAEVTLPVENDEPLIHWLDKVPGGVLAHGWRLPDKILLRDARILLESLPGRSPQAARSEGLLATNPKGKTLLEAAARANRAIGERFWGPFLERLCELPLEAVEELEVLPVGRKRLASPASRVFFPPVATAKSDTDEGEVDDIPQAVLEALRFLDASAVRLRAKGRAFTSVAAKLRDSKLVRAPRRTELLTDALLPVLEAESKKADSKVAFQLLVQAREWWAGLSPAEAGDVDLSELRVPSLDEEAGWRWEAADELYFGRHWLDARRNQLLETAYGEEPERRTVPWDVFGGRLAKEAVRERSKEAWSSFLLHCGVARGPREYVEQDDKGGQIPRTGYPLGKCPFPDVNQDLWRKYLIAVWQALPRTRGCQTFRLRWVSWIDGLERPEARAAIVEMLLDDTASYGSLLTDVIRDDTKTVHTRYLLLWVFALREMGWPVIPTEVGPVRPDEAWLSGIGERGETFGRLPRVAARHRGSELLPLLGVEAFERGTGPRLVEALARLARNLSFRDTADRSNARSFADALWSALGQAAERVYTLPDSLISHAVPVLRQGELAACVLSQSNCVVIDDDPVRGRLVELPPDAIEIPWGRRTPNSLARHLRSKLGEKRLRLTSQLPVNTGFVETGAEQPLLDVLNGYDPAAQLHAGLVIAYGTPPLAPDSAPFAEIWTRLESAVVKRGRFAPGFAESVFVERRDGRFVLELSTEADGPGDLPASWLDGLGETLVGPERERAWDAWVRLMERRLRPDGFYARLKISTSDRLEVERALHRTASSGLKVFEAFALANLRTAVPGLTVESFSKEWAQRATSLSGLVEWLSLGGFEERWQSYRSEPEERRVIQLLECFGVVSGAWQEARRDLGQGPFIFESSRRLWGTRRQQVSAALRAAAARHDAVARERVRQLVDALEPLVPEERLLAEPPNDATVLSALLSWLDESLQADAGGIARSLLRATAAIRRQMAEGSILEIELGGAVREGRLYLSEPQGIREEHARAVLDALVFLSDRLAPTQGEKLDHDRLRARAEIVAFTQGSWANKYAVLRAVKEALESDAPKTADRLTKKGVFKKPESDRRQLLALFPELPGDASPAPAATPVRQVVVLGERVEPAAADEDALEGSLGHLGEALAEAAASAPDLSELVGRRRGTLPDAASPGGGGRRAGGGGGGEREPPDVRERDGFNGEAFAYEYLRKRLQDFDASHWRSVNRTRYGLQGEGNDSLGYDFEYVDHEGALCGRPGVTCLIEVKSSAEYAPTGFMMSVNQWTVASECHGNPARSYVVLRVGDVRSKRPRLVDVLVDPIAHERDGALRLIASDFRVLVAAPGEDED